MAFSTAVIALAAVLNLTMPGEVFTLVSSIATTSFLFIWAAIIGAHLRFIKLHPADRQFKMPGAPFTDWLVLVFLAFVIVVLCFEKQTLIALLFTLAWFAVLGVTSLSQPARTKIK
mgnify:FL=1